VAAEISMGPHGTALIRRKAGALRNDAAYLSFCLSACLSVRLTAAGSKGVPYVSSTVINSSP